MSTKIKPVSKIRTIIDSLGQINEELKRLNDAKKDLDTLLKKYVEDKKLDNDNEYVFVGDLYQVNVGAVAIKREITNIEKVRDILGHTAFMGLATIKLSDIDKYLDGPQKKEVLSIKHSGSRVYKFEEAPAESNLKKKSKTKKREDNFEF